MPFEALDYFVPVRRPITAGDTGPNPQKLSALAWSSVHEDFVLWDGAKWARPPVQLATASQPGGITAADFTKLASLGAGTTTATGAAESGKVPKLSASGLLLAGWLPAASGSAAGALSSTDFTKLSTLGSGTITATGAAESGKVPKLSASGLLLAGWLPAASGSAAGALSSTDFTKLSTLGAGTSTSNGAADVGKVPKLDANGLLLAEFLPAASGTKQGAISAADFTKLGTLGAGVSTSAGAADVGKVGKLDANGLFSVTFLPQASASSPGTLASADFTKLASVSQLLETSVRHIYVSATGSNANDGLTPGAPKLTLAGAWQALPAVQSVPVVVHLGAGTFDWAEPTVLQVGDRGFIALLGDGVNVVSTGTIDSQNITEATVSVADMVVDQYAGYSLRITSGPYAGYNRTISANTTNTVTYIGNAISVTAGTTYEIYQPTSIMRGTSTMAANLNVHFVRMGIVMTGSTITFNAISQKRTTCFFGVEFKSPSSPTAHHRDWLCGHTLNADDLGGQVLKACGWTNSSVNLVGLGWGVSSVDAGIGLSASFDATVMGYLVMNGGLSANASGAVHIVVLGGRLRTLLVGSNADAVLVQTLLENPATNNASVLSLNTNARVYLANCTIRQLAGQIAVYLTEEARMVAANGGNWSSAATTSPFFRLDQNTQLSWGNGSLSVTGSTGLAYLSGNARLNLKSATFSAPTGAGTGITMYGNSVMSVDGNLSVTCTGQPLLMRGNCNLSVSGLTTLATSGAFACTSIDAGASCEFNGSVTLQNTNTGANLDGLRVLGGALVKCNAAITTTLSSASGFGINCRGGGRVALVNSPTGVIGPTADVTVGPNTADQYARTTLAASYAAVMSGMSCVQRAA